MDTSPTAPPPRPATMNSALRRNIDALMERRRQAEAAASGEERVAQAFTDFAGSMRFVYLHLVLFGAWIAVNAGLVPGAPRFDPSFVVLGMAASVEAIFLSTFVLISQNRTAAAADKRADLDLQINLLTEHELTALVAIVERVAEHLNVPLHDRAEIDEIKRDVAPEAVLEELERRGS